VYYNAEKLQKKIAEVIKRQTWPCIISTTVLLIIMTAQ